MAVESLFDLDVSHSGFLTSYKGERFPIPCVGSFASWVTSGRQASPCLVHYRGCSSFGPICADPDNSFWPQGAQGACWSLRQVEELEWASWVSSGCLLWLQVD